MRYLEDGPHALISLLPFMRLVGGVFHLVLEFEEGVFDVFEAVWWGFAVAARGTDWRHFGLRLRII